MSYIRFSLCLMLSTRLAVPTLLAIPERADFIASLPIREQRPRIWLDQEQLSRLRERYASESPAKVARLAGNSLEGLSLAWLITGERQFGRAAIRLALGEPDDPGSLHPDLASSDGANKRSAVQPSAAQQALVYDWCYPLLDETSRVMLQNSMIQEAQRLISNGRLWRSFHNTGHTTAWPVTAVALALAGDHPFSSVALAFLGPELDDALTTFDSLFGDGEWPEGVDYNRHSTFPALRTFLALKSATGNDFLAGSPHFRNSGMYILYVSKPNGLVLPADDNDWPFLGEWEHVGLLMLASQFRDGFVQYFLNHCPVERFALPEDQKWAHLLWYDPSIPEKDLSDLPRSRLFRGKGLVLARSGWGWDSPGQRDPSTWISFHCGDYFGDHTHYDLNSFEVYHRGELAIDSGRYDSDWNFFADRQRLAQSQFFNYYQRTIAHNTMLIHDPDEQFEMGVVNDGGQLQLLFQNGLRNAPEDFSQGRFPSDSGPGTRDWSTNLGRWETGEITAYQGTSLFTYVAGDASRAYSPHKIRGFVRELLFVQPDVVMVFDRVESREARFKKTWLLHSAEEPKTLAGTRDIEIRYGEGRLRLVPLLPAKSVTNLIGGPGREFEVAGKRFRCCEDSPINPAARHYGELPGAWRIEISPATSTTQDEFLNVLLVGDRNRNDSRRVEFTQDATELGVSILDEDKQKSIHVRFSRKAGEAPSLEIRELGQPVLSAKLAGTVQLEAGRP